MSKLKMPSVIVAFEEKGIEAIQRSQRSIVLLILEQDGKDMTKDYLNIYTIDDIPEDLTDENKEYIKLALLGYQTAPKKVIVYFIPPVPTTATAETGAGEGTASGDGADLDAGGEATAGDTTETTTTEETGAGEGTASGDGADLDTGEEAAAGDTTETTTTAKQDYTKILRVIETVEFVYLAIPQIQPENVPDIANWIKSMRTTKDIMVNAVLPNINADCEGVINFTNSIIRTKTKSYTAAQYCARVAGLLAGTPMTISATYAPLNELVEVERNTKEEMDARVSNGEFFFFSDGQKIKVARAVNSFVTTYQGRGDDFKFIKIMNLLDMIHNDIKWTGHDSYIGKYANNASNRALLITAINGYFKTLETEGLLERNQNRSYIDYEAVKNWRESNGLNTRDELEAMSEKELEVLNLHENVFIAADLSPLNAIENITVKCAID